MNPTAATPSMLCVYAVCSRLRVRLDLTGVAGEPLHIIAAEGLAAVVGEVVRAPRASIAAFRRHDAVVRALAGRLPAVLPVRFGNCVGGVEELRLALESRGPPLRTALRSVRGRVQMTLRGVDNGSASLSPPIAGARDSSGRAYLKARALVAAREHEGHSLVSLLPAVSQWVRAEKVERRAGIASVHHLIPRGCVAAYARAMHRTAEAAGVRMTLTGPFPPYAFGRW
jgi:hypothetical protein